MRNFWGTTLCPLLIKTSNDTLPHGTSGPVERGGLVVRGGCVVRHGVGSTHHL